MSLSEVRGTSTHTYYMKEGKRGREEEEEESVRIEEEAARLNCYQEPILRSARPSYILVLHVIEPGRSGQDRVTLTSPHFFFA